MGRFRSGLCVTQNWLNHVGFHMPRPVANWWTELVQVVGFSSGANRSSVGFRLWAGFCQKLSDLARTDWILTRSQRILKRSSRISVRSGRISMRSRHISKRSSWILTRSRLISLSSGQISIDRTKNTDEPLLPMVNSNFPASIQSGWLKIGFSTSNQPTDMPFLGSRGKDPSSTCHRRQVNLFLGQIGRVRQVGWVSILFGHP